MSGVRFNKSAQRVLNIFELFSERMEPLSVGEVAVSLSIPQPSVSVLLRNLVDMGYLHYAPASRKFSPTLRIVLLGSWIESRFSSSGNIAEHLKSLQLSLEETLIVGVQNAARAQYILANEAERPDRMIVSSGLMRPLLRSAIGRVLLSLKPDVEIAGWIRRCNADESDPDRRVTTTAFMEMMACVRTKGYAETAGDVTPGYGTIAVAFSSPMDGLPMAIACGMPLARLEQKKPLVVEALRDFAEMYGLGENEA